MNPAFEGVQEEPAAASGERAQPAGTCAGRSSACGPRPCAPVGRRGGKDAGSCQVAPPFTRCGRAPRPRPFLLPLLPERFIVRPRVFKLQSVFSSPASVPARWQHHLAVGWASVPALSLVAPPCRRPEGPLQNARRMAGAGQASPVDPRPLRVKPQAPAPPLSRPLLLQRGPLGGPGCWQGPPAPCAEDALRPRCGSQWSAS